MEGLIKGLIDAAIGNHGEDESSNNNNQNTSHSQGEERSRSTWAQVVSGEQDDHQSNNEIAPHFNPQNARNRRRKEEEGESEGRNDEQDWQTVGETTRPSPRRRPQKDEDDEERNHEQEWETVGERHRQPPRRRPQKEEDDDARNDAKEWKTVGERPRMPLRRQPQKVSMNHWGRYKEDPSQQEYSEDNDCRTGIEPSKEELADLSKACSRLWELDFNRLVPGKDYEIDCGEGKKVYQKDDMAQASLFSWLSDDIFKRPTYSRFCSLLDNYNPDVGCKEVVTSQERHEQAAFIEEISRTAPIKYLYKYLVSKGIIPENHEEFKRIMAGLWFDLYNRGGTSGSSCAFEHVFVGEIKACGEHEVSGFHNWIQFYLEESKGRVDYQGYISPRRRGEIPDAETQLLSIQFEWNSVLKSVSSTLIGVSPEFEIALYTLCFYLGGEDNYIQLGPYPVNIKCYHQGRDKIGSVFPIAQC